jgi:hypothetical protein
MTTKEYKNTKIYKIWSVLGDKIYIGSTTKEYLSQRMTSHRYNYKSYTNKKKSIFITSFILFDEYGIENCSIELLEAKECKSIEEVKQLEGSYIRRLECVNKRCEGISRQESQKKYFQNHKESFKIYYQNHKESQLTYRQDHREKAKEYAKNKYESIKDIFIDCECGCKISQKNKDQHLRTKKHLKSIQQILEQEIDI